ncbi:RNA-binding protein NOB1 [Senna tora]|uniref:RNA-binding protein NOB1 n=1 Tax=Senna tora TaxID=362788 RepID=A0A834STW3_9FABA|nr:RNA-binding protein NOB1 [Senna tora]
MEEAPVSATTNTCWSNVVKTPQPPPPKPAQDDPLQAGRIFVESCKSSNGISVAVVDANAIIAGGERLHNCADKFVSVPEVMEEIRDPVSRHRLSFIPFTVETMEPSPEAMNKVVKFARATGDLQTLSEVDLKLIALTYTLEAQIHGTNHLRDIPPPVQMVNVKRLPEKDMPGWGSNVPNLEEWEALEHETEDKSNSNSRILPLRDLNLNIVTQDDHSEDGSVGIKSEAPCENLDGVDHGQLDDNAGIIPHSENGILKQMNLEEASFEVLDGENKLDTCSEELQSNGSRLVEIVSNIDETMAPKPCDLDTADGESNHFEVASETSEAADFSFADDDGSEQSWMLRSLSESSVACVTGDFAMQNVLLQMGLRLLAPGGAQIHQLHRWILRCHACYTVTAEIGRIFCPKCGNGGTLRKVAVTVGENGAVLAARRPRITLRGTKYLWYPQRLRFSLPLPQGGRDAVTKNLILQERQQADKRTPFQPPVRKALAVFSGKRNPNDNHFSRSKQNLTQRNQSPWKCFYPLMNA